VEFWLSKRGIPATEELVAKILSHAKLQDHILTEDEVRGIIPAAR
jgi:hypothetical protein